MAQWRHDLEGILQNVEHDPLPSPVPPLTGPSIYRVPDLLRKLNEEAYTPQFISIGPFHYGSQKLQSMENCKRKCLKYFIEHHGVMWDALEDFMRLGEVETEVRNSYAEAILIESNDFMKMILFDASFIIVLFLKTWEEFMNSRGLMNSCPTDVIKIEPLMAGRIQLDLILLENQLPFSFINRLYNRFANGYPFRCPTFMELTFLYFDCFNIQKLPVPTPDRYWDVEHFVDLLRQFYLSPKRHGRIRPIRSAEVQEMFCASKLAEIGIKFKPHTSTDCWLDIKYSNGVLEIPKFNLNDDTEICARNVVALEQCHCRQYAYVTDYFFMLCFLIRARSDMDLLHGKGIIVERPIGNIMATLPKDICTNISSWNINKEYHDICKALTKFYRNRWCYVLRSTLKKGYFNTPWMGAASLGAIILLLLTLVQTACSVFQTYKQF